MTITPTPEWDEWWAEAAKNSLQNPSEPFEFYCQVPKQLGKGYVRDIEVYPQVWLGIDNHEYYDDVLFQDCDCDHPLQFAVCLSGTARDGFGGQIGEGYTLISGGGIQPSIQQAFQWRPITYTTTDKVRRNLSLDTDNRGVLGVITNDNFRTDVYDLNLNLTGRFTTGSIAHQLVLGADLGRYNNSYDGSFADAPPLDAFNPVYGLPPTGPRTPYGASNLTDTLGIYLQDQLTLAPNLKLLLGGRFDLFEQSSEDLVAGTQSSLSGDAFSPRLGIVYQPIQPISLYASYSSSFSPVTGISFEGEQFQPERGTQYEVGVKADLNSRLSATLALYDFTRSGVLTADTRPGVPPGLFSIQTGEQRSRGVELSIAGEILPGWNILAGYAYTNAEISEDNTLPVGNRLASVPENAINFWTTYEIQSGDLQGLGVGLGLFFVGERQGNIANTYQVPSYLRTDASIFYKRDQFRAGLNFRNLFDVEYIESTEYDLGVSYGEPLTVQATISWQF